MVPGSSLTLTNYVPYNHDLQLHIESWEVVFHDVENTLQPNDQTQLAWCDVWPIGCQQERVANYSIWCINSGWPLPAAGHLVTTWWWGAGHNAGQRISFRLHQDLGVHECHRKQTGRMTKNRKLFQSKCVDWQGYIACRKLWRKYWGTKQLGEKINTRGPINSNYKTCRIKWIKEYRTPIDAWAM